MLTATRLSFEFKDSFNPERPSRKDVIVYEPDGSVYEGALLLSPSSWDNYMRCPRIWVFDKIDDVPRVERSFHKIGRALHKEILEDWLIAKKPPQTRAVLDSGVLGLFPRPRPGLIAEGCFVLRLRVGDQEVTTWGFKDLTFVQNGVVHLTDLKTTSDLKWQKTKEELRRDTQCLLYSLDECLKHEVDEVACRWVYMTRSKPFRSDCTELVITRQHAEEQLAGRVAAGADMAEHLERKGDHEKGEVQVNGIPFRYAALRFPAVPEECNRYAGCDHKKALRCQDINPLVSLKTAFRQDKEARARKALSKKPTNTQKRRTAVGFLDKVKNKNPEEAAAAPTVSVTKAEEAPAEAVEDKTESKPAEAVEDKTESKPAKGRKKLSDVTKAARSGEAPAKAADNKSSVNPPDARPPEEAQEEAEEEEKVKAEKEATKEAKKTKAAKTRKKKKTASQFEGFVLLLDCHPMKGLEVQDIEELLQPARQEVELDAGMSYRLMEYNDGPKALGAQVLENLQNDPPVGVYHAWSRVLDREVLDALVRVADTVLKGGF